MRQKEVLERETGMVYNVKTTTTTTTTYFLITCSSSNVALLKNAATKLGLSSIIGYFVVFI